MTAPGINVDERSREGGCVFCLDRAESGRIAEGAS
jgi:hypothetical protein